MEAMDYCKLVLTNSTAAVDTVVIRQSPVPRRHRAPTLRWCSPQRCPCVNWANSVPLFGLVQSIRAAVAVESAYRCCSSSVARTSATKSTSSAMSATPTTSATSANLSPPGQDTARLWTLCEQSGLGTRCIGDIDKPGIERSQSIVQFLDKGIFISKLCLKFPNHCDEHTWLVATLLLTFCLLWHTRLYATFFRTNMHRNFQTVWRVPPPSGM
jgi:hypothetical protein